MNDLCAELYKIIFEYIGDKHKEKLFKIFDKNMYDELVNNNKNKVK